MDISTGTTITPCVGDGQNSDTNWVSNGYFTPITRANSIQARVRNYLIGAFIITKNCTEGLPDLKNISLDKSKIKITLTSWIAWIRSYMKDNM